MNNKETRTTKRFGIGEWYGKLFANMGADELKSLAAFQSRKRKPTRPNCPFQSRDGPVPCNKVGGVCSIRLYQKSPLGVVNVADGEEGRLRTVCPKRFEEDGLIYRWVSGVILGSNEIALAAEVGFLERVSTSNQEDSNDDVGRIDMVLAIPHSDPMACCALEVQAVYFSGGAMTKEWPPLLSLASEGIPFPVGTRRPDYRSSGPKRLMPQLQIKVPTLRRWGKKMAVVVDLDFWEALGPMDRVADVSNCDIAWFIVKYVEIDGKATLTRDRIQFTTLERAVEGLTAGRPVSLEVFETRIGDKLITRVYPS